VQLLKPAATAHLLGSFVEFIPSKDRPWFKSILQAHFATVSCTAPDAPQQSKRAAADAGAEAARPGAAAGQAQARQQQLQQPQQQPLKRLKASADVPSAGGVRAGTAGRPLAPSNGGLQPPARPAPSLAAVGGGRAGAQPPAAPLPSALQHLQRASQQQQQQQQHPRKQPFSKHNPLMGSGGGGGGPEQAALLGQRTGQQGPGSANVHQLNALRAAMQPTPHPGAPASAAGLGPAGGGAAGLAGPHPGRAALASQGTAFALAAGASRPGAGVGAAAPAAVVGRQRACVLCSKPMDGPHAAACGHLACYACWMKLLSGAPRGAQCPKCRKDVRRPQLKVCYFA